MTSLVLRRVRRGKMAKLKWVPVPVVLGPISEAVVKLERVQIVCPACGQQVQAVATDGRVKGYCAVVKQYVDLLIETQRWQDPEYRAKVSADMKKRWQDPEYRAKMNAAIKKRGQDPEYRAKMSAAANNHGPDAEHRAKISAAVKKRWQDPEYRAKMKAAHSKKHDLGAEAGNKKVGGFEPTTP